MTARVWQTKDAGAPSRRPAPPANQEDAVAIVGWSGLFPKAGNIDELWSNLQQVADCTSPLAESPEMGPDYVARTSALADFDKFDADFFGYSPREAAMIDPQQRLFLQQAWHALENAGHAPDSADIGSVGVFAGCGISTYLLTRLMRHPSFATMDPIEVLMSNDKDFVATRVACKLGLRGPAMTVQTACSTSLVATHTACRALLAMECDTALAGGSTVLLPTGTGYLYTEGGIRSPDGLCRPFDRDGDGTIFGSGVATVVLKRLADALDQNCTIHAVILASAVNNDGDRKIGFSAPSVEGQAEAISEALAVAGLRAEDIGAVECHGTATRLGDPVEVEALTQAFMENSDLTADQLRGRCVLGSVKGNLGHLDTAAGISGLIKAALMVRDGILPGTAHFRAPNPALNLEETPFAVRSDTQAWEDWRPRTAGVSSFGVGGTNAHVIVAAPPAPTATCPETPTCPDTDVQLLPLSARTPEALQRHCARMADALTAREVASLRDVAFTLQTGRVQFEHRLAVTAATAAEAVRKLRSAPRTGARCLQGKLSTVLAFPGQGTQRAGMAAAFYRELPVFAGAIERCLALMEKDLAARVRRCLLDEGPVTEALIAETVHTQPALFIMGYALVESLKQVGIDGDCAIGHSIGEYLAAHWAGVFSLDDALALVCARGFCMQDAPEGAMALVALCEDELAPLIADDEVEVAVINSPDSCVLAGTVQAMAASLDRLEAAGIGAQRLRTKRAFHSGLMDGVLDRFRASLDRVRLSPARRPFISNLTGGWISPERASDPAYWVEHLRGRVRFAEGLRRLRDDSPCLLLEFGPGASVSAFAGQSAGTHPCRAIPLAGAKDNSGSQGLLQALGAFWCAGGSLPWQDWHDGGARRVPLPGYPFAVTRHWLDLPADRASDPAPEMADAVPAAPSHARPALDVPFAVPRGPLEKDLCRLWEEVLGIGGIGIDDNFFALGGSSVQVLEVVRRAKAEGRVLTARDVFENPTVAELASHIAGAADGALPDAQGDAHPRSIAAQAIAPDMAETVLSALKKMRP